MLKFIKLIIPALALGALTSCEKDLDLRYHDIEPLTVIEGVVTPDGAGVSITETTPMDEPLNLTRFTDAAVSVTDLTTGQLFALEPDSDGLYNTVDNQANFSAGHQYMLVVERNGDTFSAVTRMFGPTQITNLEFNWIEMPYDRVAVLKCEFLDDPSVDGEYFWLRIYRNGEIYAWEALDDRGSEQGVISYLTMTTREDIEAEDDSDLLLDGDRVTVTVCPISREMHDYLQAIGNDSSGPALFSGPRCLGYFMATTPAEREIIFRPAEIPLYRP